MSIRILEGDALQVLQTLPDCSVQCCVTSPPYFGLRDYGTGTWEGGDASCAHKIGREMGNANKGAVRTVLDGDLSRCKCGSIRADRQLGLEKTPDLYVGAMVGVFREVKRVLRDDGTLWLNIGDSYAGSFGAQSRGKPGAAPLSAKQGSGRAPEVWGTGRPVTAKVDGCKPKDLIGIPWLLAFALRADGWYLRSDIIWAKPNPMPESVTDRPTKAHEYLFLLTKSPTYYYDANAIAEPSGAAGEFRSFSTAKKAGRAFDVARSGNEKEGAAPVLVGANRNRRSVWTVTTSPYSEAHFATFPPKLIEPCILAGSAKGQTVLDPFGGAGTTGLVADRLGRDALLIELNPAYAEMARRRIHSDNPLFGDVA